MSASQTSYPYSDYSNSTNTPPDSHLYSSFSDRNLLRSKSRPSKHRHKHKNMPCNLRSNISNDMNIINGYVYTGHSQTYSNCSYKNHTYNEDDEKYDKFDSLSENNEHKVFANYRKSGKYMNREQKRKYERKREHGRKRESRRKYEEEHERALQIAFQEKQKEKQMKKQFFEKKTPKDSHGNKISSNHSSKHSRTYTSFAVGSSQNQYEINHRSYKAARKRNRRKRRHKQHGRHGVYCNALKVQASNHQRLNSSLQKLKNKQKIVHKVKNKKTKKVCIYFVCDCVFLFAYEFFCSFLFVFFVKFLFAYVSYLKMYFL